MRLALVTQLTAGVLTLLYFWISIEVIAGRRKHRISLGQGANDEIAGLVSAHANFSAYVPMLLILLYLSEQSLLFPVWLLTMLSGIIMIGRLSHFVALAGRVDHFRFRKIGMHMTLWPMLVLALMSVCVSIAAFFS